MAALHASVDRVRANVKWLVDFLGTESARLERADGREKEELEAAIAAARAELSGERENLHARLNALATEIEAELLDARNEWQRASDDAREPVESRIVALETSLTVCAHELVLSFLDHMELMTAHTTELKTKAAGAGAEAAKAIDEQLHDLEVRMRKYRAELTAVLGSAAARDLHSLDRLRAEAPLQGLVKRVDQQHAAMKADLRRLEKEDSRVWQDRTAAFRRSWCALFESVDHARRLHRDRIF